jgi:hypothetical protein
LEATEYYSNITQHRLENQILKLHDMSKNTRSAKMKEIASTA